MFKCSVCGCEAKITKNGIDYCFGSHPNQSVTGSTSGHTHVGGRVIMTPDGPLSIPHPTNGGE
jgi:hypothetical protein